MGGNKRKIPPGVIDKAVEGKVSSKNVHEILDREGIHEFDAAKVTKFLEIRQQVNVRKLEELFRQVKEVELRRNAALK